MMPKPLLIVDDDVDFRANLEDILVNEGYDPITAGLYSEALDVVRSRKVIAALIDLKLPDGSGTRLLADVKQDVLKQYSYAFAITPSFFDADLSRTGEFVPADKLYHIRILVYRNFAVTEHTEQPDPVYELDFEVAL